MPYLVSKREVLSLVLHVGPGRFDRAQATRVERLFTNLAYNNTLRKHPAEFLEIRTIEASENVLIGKLALNGWGKRLLIKHLITLLKEAAEAPSIRKYASRQVYKVD